MDDIFGVEPNSLKLGNASEQIERIVAEGHSNYINKN